MADSNENLIKKLDEFDQRYCQIDVELAGPEVGSDYNKAIALGKEQGKLKAMVTKYREYKEAVAGVADSKEMLEDPELDEEFAELAKAEIEELQAKSEKLIEEIKETIVMADDASIDSVIMEIRPDSLIRILSSSCFLS